MEITDIRIRTYNQTGPMKAVVSATFDNAIAIHDIKVIFAQNRYFVVMPNKKNFDGTFRDIVHPINSECRQMLEKVIISAYMDKLEEEKLDENNAEENMPETVGQVSE